MAMGGGDAAPGPDYMTSGLASLEIKLQLANGLPDNDLGACVLPESFGQLLEDMGHAFHRDAAAGPTTPLSPKQYFQRLIGMHGASYSLEECAVIRDLVLTYSSWLEQSRAMPTPVIGVLNLALAGSKAYHQGIPNPPNNETTE